MIEMVQRPKKIMKNFRNRNIAIGKERRRNMQKLVLENQPHFPKTLNYEDIDLAVTEWLEKEFDLTYDGKKFKTYKLFSNQRISEYGQTWQNLDEKGNVDINFKTITRESNPQKGEIYGGNYTIPGNITFPIFNVRSLDENGMEFIERYSMKQPFAVNLIYTIGVFTNSYKILNEMNTLVHKQFKSLEKYIFPNGFAIPMELNSVSDESEYTIDDRKYYSQTFQIKVMSYIITKDDYIVTKIQSRVRMPLVSGKDSSYENCNCEYEIDMAKLPNESKNNINCNVDFTISPKEDETKNEIMEKPSGELEVEMEELIGKQVCWEDTEDELYVNRKVVYSVTIDYCNIKDSDNEFEFVSEYNLSLESIELKNIKSYKLFINNCEINVSGSDVNIFKGDTVKMYVVLKNEKELAYTTIVTYDVDSIIENDNNVVQNKNVDINA